MPHTAAATQHDSTSCATSSCAATLAFRLPSTRLPLLLRLPAAPRRPLPVRKRHRRDLGTALAVQELPQHSAAVEVPHPNLAAVAGRQQAALVGVKAHGRQLVLRAGGARGGAG